MVEMKIEVRDSLAPQIQSFGVWFATIIELAAANFKAFSPHEASAQLVEFLSQNPLPSDVLICFLSETHQDRLDYLLDLNGEGEINENQARGIKRMD